MVMEVQQVVRIEIKIPGRKFSFLMHHGEKPVHFHPGRQFFIKMIKGTQVKSVYFMKRLADSSQVKTDFLLCGQTDSTEQAECDENAGEDEELFHAAKDKKTLLYAYDLCWYIA